MGRRLTTSEQMTLAAVTAEAFDAVDKVRTMRETERHSHRGALYTLVEWQHAISAVKAIRQRWVAEYVRLRGVPRSAAFAAFTRNVASVKALLRVTPRD